MYRVLARIVRTQQLSSHKHKLKFRLRSVAMSKTAAVVNKNRTTQQQQQQRTMRGRLLRQSSKTTATATDDDDDDDDDVLSSGQSASDKYQLVTFFKFATIENPEEECSRHKEYIEENELEIRGRIYLNEQGVNAQMSGRGRDGEQYARWVSEREEFRGMRVSVYPYHEHGHPDLRLRTKPQLVQLEKGTRHLPIQDKRRRGESLSPEEWHEMIGNANEDPMDLKNPLLLDVRNGYEWDVGHFKGAARPVQESFRETVETNVDHKIGPLANMPKDKPIMMYCTGGIRCDVYSTVLKEQGYENVMVLEGGVQAYFEKYGKEEEHAWDNHLFVFDNRLAMTPQGLPAADLGEKAATLRCHCCGESKAPPPHRNCPNVDCNRLFLVCPGCSQKLDGFCCEACTQATHVRPQLVNPGRYQKYEAYDTPEARAARRGEGRNRRKNLRILKRKLACAEYVIRTKINGGNDESDSSSSMSGTFAARTRSNTKIENDEDEEGDKEDEEDEEWDSDGNGKKIKPANSKYARTRMRLEEAIAFVQGDMTPENLVNAMEKLNTDRVQMNREAKKQQKESVF